MREEGQTKAKRWKSGRKNGAIVATWKTAVETIMPSCPGKIGAFFLSPRTWTVRLLKSTEFWAKLEPKDALYDHSLVTSRFVKLLPQQKFRIFTTSITLHRLMIWP